MPTKLYNSIIVGPIRSRRLGNSLGINLLPEYGKMCTFDCIYCECGWNRDNDKDKKLPSPNQVEEALRTRLKECTAEGIGIDSITFSGNGEPTLHPQFAEIVDITLRLRDEFCRKAKVSVLSNSTMLWKEEVRQALMRLDNPILKIDSAIEDYVKIINKPAPSFSLEETIAWIKKFNGNFVLQTMFLKGGGVDCTNPRHVLAWVDLVRELRPREIMMYSLDRDTPSPDLTEVSTQEMEQIAEPLIKEGFKVMISGKATKE